MGSRSFFVMGFTEAPMSVGSSCPRSRERSEWVHGEQSSPKVQIREAAFLSRTIHEREKSIRPALNQGGACSDRSSNPGGGIQLLHDFHSKSCRTRLKIELSPFPRAQ